MWAPSDDGDSLDEEGEDYEYMDYIDEYGPPENYSGDLNPETFQRMGPKIGRNEPCPCGSGKKYKKCCGV